MITYLSLSIYIYVYKYIYMIYLCMYIYIYIYIYICNHQTLYWRATRRHATRHIHCTSAQAMFVSSSHKQSLKYAFWSRC